MSTRLFETIHIEGGLLSVEHLHRVSSMRASAQAGADYCVPEGLTLPEEIGRAWKIARALRQKSLADGKFAPEFLQKVLGFGDITAYRHGAEEESPTHTANSGEVPIVIARQDDGLDKRQDGFLPGRQITPFNLAQNHLNSNDKSQWGIVCDDNNLRLLRDSTSLTRAAYIEADLHRMLEEGEGHYSDFKALYLTAHASRFAPAAACPLEKWREESVQTGIRAHDKMRSGVQKALLALGNGFLHHHENGALKAEVAESGGMEKYYRELLWLVYRMIFLFVTEDRGTLQGDSISKEKKDAYRHGYGISRLRARAMRPAAADNYDDLWEGLKYTFSAMQGGRESKYLGLPELGGLFGADRCEMLQGRRLRNGDLLKAVHALSWMRGDDKRRTRINYRDMGANELGSIYESLLELTPYCDIRGNFYFYELSAQENRGNARRTTGSYYTPDVLVNELVESTLGPILKDVEEESDILALRVLDPACGSGHFLLAAANRMARELICLRDEDGDVGESVRRRHMREIVEKCIFGVDKNRMALDLAKTALWLETFDSEKPLLLLDNHLQWGDSLLGVRDLQLLSNGIPDEAYKPLVGDDKELCTQLRKSNKKERTDGTGSLLVKVGQDLAREMEKVESMPEDTLDQVADKGVAHQKLTEMLAETGIGVAADMFSAAFLMAKRTDSLPPTSIDMFTAMKGNVMLDSAVTKAARACAKENRVFHWWLRYLLVKDKGFHVVLANPPWERVTLQEVEFFAHRAPNIAQAQNQSARRTLIAKLGEAGKDTREYQLWLDFQRAKHAAKSASNYAHNSGNYPLTGAGDVNTYALFAELSLRLLNKDGAAGIIVPTGIATGDANKTYFSHLIEGKRLKSLYDFENGGISFPDVHRSFRFVLMSISSSERFDFFAFARTVADLKDDSRHIVLGADNLRLVNPNTCTLPPYRTQKDCDVCEKIYRAVKGVFWRDEGNVNPWQVRFQRMFDMSADGQHFRNDADKGCVRLYEAKYMHQYDHRWRTFEKVGVHPRSLSASERKNPACAIATRYHVDEHILREYLASAVNIPHWLLAGRLITSATVERTLIYGILPLSAVGHSAVVLHSPRLPDEKSILLALFNSVVVDYAARQKTANTNLAYADLKQMPILPPDAFTAEDKQAIVPAVLELVYTAHDIKPFYDDIVRQNPHYDPRPPHQHGTPFAWDDERRAELRAAIDARIALKYGITRDELRYILDPADVMGEDYPSETFRVLKESEIEQHGEYRTRRLVLEAFDALTSSS